MMSGTIFGRQALLNIVIRIPNQNNLAIEFVIDTGFKGELTLPISAVIALGLPFSHIITAGLANNTASLVDVHTLTIVWDGVERQVDVLAMGKQPLVGMSLLEGFHIEADFADGGDLTLTRLPSFP